MKNFYELPSIRELLISCYCATVSSILPTCRAALGRKGDNGGLCHPTLKDSQMVNNWSANNLFHGPGFV